MTPDAVLDPSLQATPLLADRLTRQVARHPALLVAFSGGVDSATLLAAAVRALGPDRVLAATADSPSLPDAERHAARDVAGRLGAAHRFVPSNELDDERYRANGRDRCYFCKTELMTVLVPLLSEMPDGARLATGTNAEDLRSPHRPGIRAAAERGAVTPLADAGLDKPAVRRLAQHWQVPVWDKPQAACLASRVAYGLRISPATLGRVEAAENAARLALAGSGLRTVDLRVRDLGAEGARIELDHHLAKRPGDWRENLCAAVRAAGFPTAVIDPRGFRSGSMNEPR